MQKKRLLPKKTNQPTIDCETKQSIVRWQLWLAKVNAWLGTTQPQKKKKELPVDNNHGVKKRPLPHEICTYHPVDDFHSLLPQWNWYPRSEEFTWSPQCDDIPFPNTSVSVTPSNWDKVFAWIKHQKWKPCEGGGSSWLEIAVQSYFDGLRLDNLYTPKSYVHAIQKVVNQTAKIDTSIQLTPAMPIKRQKNQW